MTNNQLIQEYDFDPTLTTSELRALEEARKAKERKAHMRKIGLEVFDRYEILGIEPEDLAEAFDGDLEAIVAFCKANLHRELWIGENNIYIATDYEAHYKWQLEAEKHLEKVTKDTEKAIKEFLANPTKENAKKASGLVDFHSDYYKDINNFRPHGYWSYLFARFTPKHTQVWNECYR